MKQLEPELLSCCNWDSSYGRLLRRLDQALDVARTRQWLAGQPSTLEELELYGLSKEDLILLKRILERMDADLSSVAFPDLATRQPAHGQTGNH